MNNMIIVLIFSISLHFAWILLNALSCTYCWSPICRKQIVLLMNDLQWKILLSPVSKNFLILGHTWKTVPVKRFINSTYIIVKGNVICNFIISIFDLPWLLRFININIAIGRETVWFEETHLVLSELRWYRWMDSRDWRTNCHWRCWTWSYNCEPIGSEAKRMYTI